MIRLIVCPLLLSLASIGFAAKLDGASLALKSSGEQSGKCWKLSANGFVGTYVKVANAGEVTIAVEASGVAPSSATLMVGASGVKLELTDKPTKLSEKFTLPAGTHFVRVECFNLANHANFGLPVTDLASPGFGRILEASPSRLVQFGWKLLC